MNKQMVGCLSLNGWVYVLDGCWLVHCCIVVSQKDVWIDRYKDGWLNQLIDDTLFVYTEWMDGSKTSVSGSG